MFGQVCQCLVGSAADLRLSWSAGTGTFGRVCLCREKATRSYWAMKILAIQDVIRLKQIEHIRNEKLILSIVRHPFIIEM